MRALILIAVAGLLGPLLGSFRRWPVPVVVGEVIGGIIIGPAVLGWVSIADPVVNILHTAGFAVLMFTVALHLPLRDKTLRKGIRPASLAIVGTFAVGFALGGLISWLLGLPHLWTWGLLCANSSAALALPVLRPEPDKPIDESTGRLVVWIAGADLLAVLLVPLTTSSRGLGKVVLGSLIVTAVAWVSFFALRALGRRRWWSELRTQSRHRGWGVDLRVALILLFGLTWIAQGSGTSALVAGFAAGIAVSALGADERLLTEVVGIGEGFFIPAFFVALGTTLRPQSLVDSKALELVALLVAGSLLAHLAGSLLVRLGGRGTLVSSAQLGVPAAVVTIGAAGHWLRPAEATAIMGVALISIGLCSLGAAIHSQPLPRDRGTLTHLLAPFTHPGETDAGPLGPSSV